MLPEKLSTDITSLGLAADRQAIVVEMVVAADGSVQAPAIYRAWVRNRAKLAYNSVAAWLEGGSPPAAVAAVPGLDENLRLQDKAAQALKGLRQLHGALTFETLQGRAKFEGDEVRDVEVEKPNRATQLIEDFMVAANCVTAEFLEGKKFPCLRRVVRTPKRWDRIVEIAQQHGCKLPAEPDSRALNEFLIQQKAADPLRFPDLSLAVIKLLGPGEYVAETPGDTAAAGAFWPGRGALFAFHRAQSPLSGYHYSAAVESRPGGPAGPLRPRRPGGLGTPLHPAGRCGQEGRTAGGQVRGGDALAVEDRPAVRGHRHRGGGKRDLGPGFQPAGRRQAGPGPRGSTWAIRFKWNCCTRTWSMGLLISRGCSIAIFDAFYQTPQFGVPSRSMIP